MCYLVELHVASNPGLLYSRLAAYCLLDLHKLHLVMGIIHNDCRVSHVQYLYSTYIIIHVHL